MDLPLIDGMTETGPDTEPMVARLERLMADYPGRAQDSLQRGIAQLQQAVRLESNKQVRSNIREALAILHHGPSDEQDTSEDTRDTARDDDETS